MSIIILISHFGKNDLISKCIWLVLDHTFQMSFLNFTPRCLNLDGENISVPINNHGTVFKSVNILVNDKP